jgi:hypothetical protein
MTFLKFKLKENNNGIPAGVYPVLVTGRGYAK